MTVPCRVTCVVLGVPTSITVTMVVGAILIHDPSKFWMIPVVLLLPLLPYLLLFGAAMMHRNRKAMSIVVLVGASIGVGAEFLYVLGAFFGKLDSDLSLMTFPVFLWSATVLTGITALLAALILNVKSTAIP